MAAVTIEQIDSAITKIVQTGQSVSMPNGESYTRANLDSLRALRAELETKQAAAGGSGGFGFRRVQIRDDRH